MTQSIIYIVSDSVGETAELVTKAAISQFSGHDITIRRVPFVEDTATVDEVVAVAKLNNAIVAYTLVKPDIRSYMTTRTKEVGVTSFDIIGPLIDILEKTYDIKPLEEPGLVRKLDENYFKRVEAIEFAVKYDDGRDPRGIVRSDIVLVGVSRTSKTPLSQFLAHKRFKVANVPIVPEVDPPEELFQVDPSKCIGLKISPEKLNNIRRERLKSLGLSDRAIYANIERIKEELEYFEQVVSRLQCPVIDVTNKAVEETANLIENLFNERLNRTLS